MAKRSASGRPDPYHRKDGRWSVQVELAPVSGKRRRKAVYAATRGEVVRRAREIEQAQDAGLPVGDARLTVGRYLSSWITDTLPMSGLRPSTIDSYAEVANLHLIPTLGHIRLADLRAPQIRRLLATKGEESTARGKPLSARSVQKIHAVLRTALSGAVRDDVIPRNPAFQVQPPKVPKPIINTHTDEEVDRVLAAVAADRLAAMWLVLLTTGLRKGEVLGLEWADFDLPGHRMAVARSLNRLRGPADPITGKRVGRLVDGPVKTVSAERILWLPDVVVAAMLAHRKNQAREQLAAPAWAEPGRVFTSRSGTPIDPRNVNRMWARLCRDAGVRSIRVHDVRHGAATILLKEGVPLPAISQVLGHARTSTTADIYAHVTDEMARDGAVRMDEFLRRART